MTKVRTPLLVPTSLAVERLKSVSEGWNLQSVLAISRGPGLQLVEVLYGLVEELESKTVEQTREIIPRVGDLAGVTKSIDDRLEGSGSFYQTILFSMLTFYIETEIPPTLMEEEDAPGAPWGIGLYKSLSRCCGRGSSCTVAISTPITSGMVMGAP